MKSPDKSPDRMVKIKCAACHTELMVPPEGATAGVCPGLSCLQLGVLTSERLRDFNAVAREVLTGKMVSSLEPETLITWLAQAPLKPPPPAILGYDDDGFKRFRDPSSPHGQTVRPEVDTLLGDDPRLNKWREAMEPSPETGYTVTVSDPPPGVEPDPDEAIEL
jgi:hypothetical protein